MRRMEPSGSFCSSVAPRPSVLASQSERSGRDVLIVATQSGKAKYLGGCEFRKESANDIFYCGLSRVVLGRVRRAISGRGLR